MKLGHERFDNRPQVRLDYPEFTFIGFYMEMERAISRDMAIKLEGMTLFAYSKKMKEKNIVVAGDLISPCGDRSCAAKENGEYDVYAEERMRIDS